MNQTPTSRPPSTCCGENAAALPQGLSIRAVFEVNRPGNEILKHATLLLYGDDADGENDAALLAAAEALAVDTCADSICEACGKASVFVGFDLDDRMLCRDCYDRDPVATIFPFAESDYQNFRVRSLLVGVEGDALGFADERMDFAQLRAALPGLAAAARMRWPRLLCGATTPHPPGREASFPVRTPSAFPTQPVKSERVAFSVLPAK
jgi:hypothetical protein